MNMQQIAEQNSDKGMTDLNCTQQRLIHGGTYLLNKKGEVTINDGSHLVLSLPGYDLVSLGEALLEAGVDVSQIYQVEKK